ncbi:hypothetical protein H7Y21_03720 [Arenimonas sp.]|nr:hypothetical protein [Candidatus Parcubacteria bacterium]
MDRKKLVMFGTIVGGYAGGYIPALWGAGGFTMWGILFSAIGSLVGIWIGFQLGE